MVDRGFRKDFIENGNGHENNINSNVPTYLGLVKRANFKQDVLDFHRFGEIVAAMSGLHYVTFYNVDGYFPEDIIDELRPSLPCSHNSSNHRILETFRIFRTNTTLIQAYHDPLSLL
jgi:hypothetical protein